jgi:L-alanine-DL-glutamate epimerase-like enolase superfamily enzyme
VPVTRQGIADSTHQLTHWGTPGVIIRTDESISGFGYTGTHAHLPTDRLITQFIGESYAPLLIASDPLEVRSLWSKLLYHAPLQWVGRAGISHLALSGDRLRRAAIYRGWLCCK